MEEITDAESFLEFFNEKFNSFIELLESKNIPEINLNIYALKFINSINKLGPFIKELIIPVKEQIFNKDIQTLQLICPKDKVESIAEKFSASERDEIFKFLNLMIDCVEYL